MSEFGGPAKLPRQVWVRCKVKCCPEHKSTYIQGHQTLLSKRESDQWRAVFGAKSECGCEYEHHRFVLAPRRKKRRSKPKIPARFETPFAGAGREWLKKQKQKKKRK